MDPIKMGQRAKQILRDEVFLAAISSLDSRIVQEWRTAELMADRERAHIKQQVLKDLIAELETILGNGDFEEDLEHVRERLKERAAQERRISAIR